LKNVLRVLDPAEQAAGHRQDHRAVPLHQGGEGSFLAAVHEALEQLSVARFVPGGSRHRLAKIVEEAFHGSLLGTGATTAGASIFARVLPRRNGKVACRAKPSYNSRRFMGRLSASPK